MKNGEDVRKVCPSHATDDEPRRNRWRRLRRHGRLGLLTAVGAVVLAACSSTSSSSTSSASSSAAKASSLSGAPVVFHAVIGETGSASFLGSREAKALQLLASQVNASGGIDGHKMELDIANNESTPSLAVSIASKWISQGVSFLLNGSVVATDQAVDALATSNGPFIYDLSPGVHPKPGSMVFSAGISTKSQAEAALNFLKSKGYDRIAVINETSATGVDGYNNFSTDLASGQFSGMKLVSHETFASTDSSVTTQLSNIKSANPQALVIWTTGPSLGVVFRGMDSLGMQSLPTVTTPANASVAELTSYASSRPTHLYLPTGTDYLTPAEAPSDLQSVLSSFDTAVQKDGGHPGDPWALSYDPALLLVHALEKLGVNATAKQILSYMESLHNVPGVFGLYNTSTTNHRGVGTQSIFVTEWTGSTFKPVSGPAGQPVSGGASS
jgi:branched-chain amino acid transport system substrate-binding protein